MMATSSSKPETITEIIATMESDQQMIHYHNAWAKFRYKYRMPLAEFLGTFICIATGLCCSIVSKIGPNTDGNFVTSSLGWGFASMMGIYTCGGISGAHLNPVISIVLSVFRGFPISKCIQYVIAQFLASFCATAVCYGIYRDAIIHMGTDLTINESGMAFFTTPKDFVSNFTAFISDVLATAILICTIFALCDEQNIPPSPGMQAPVIGLMVVAISMGLSYNSGGCLNPIRDLGARLFAFAVGYGGKETMLARDLWWTWGGWGGPLTGGMLGAFLYDLFIFNGEVSPVNFSKRQWKDVFGRMKLSSAGSIQDEEN